jgi:hypothetical protein
MITREEYNKALDIIEAYHKQLFTNSVSIKFTPVSKWIKLKKCSSRLRNVLLNVERGNPEWIEYQEDCIENIKIDMMAKFPNCGTKCLDEFKELRGY